MRHRRDAVAREQSRLRALWVTPGNALGRSPRGIARTGIEITRDSSALDCCDGPSSTTRSSIRCRALVPGVDEPEIAEQVEIACKYEAIWNASVRASRRHEATAIPVQFNYDEVRGLSAEVLIKLKASLPTTIGQAQRISGVTPAAISLLLVHLRRGRHVA